MKRELPCFPCPHKSICCRWGTFLSKEEADAIEAEHSDTTYFYEDDKEYRTQVRNGRCVFFKDGGCSLHDKEYYPRVCRIFPFKDGRNPELPLAFDHLTCPEMH